MTRTRWRVVHVVDPLSMVTLCGVSVITPGWRAETGRRDRFACLRCMDALVERTVVEQGDASDLLAEWAP